MNKYFLVLVLCFLFTGCNYLDTEPGDVITTDHFWNTASSSALEQYCNTYYPKLIKGHGNPLDFTLGDMIQSEYQSDNLLSSSANIVTYGQNSPLLTSSDWDWSVIRGCNEFINNYERSPASEIEKKKYAGEILFFKAFDYFNKVRLFGDVPWYDNTLNKNDPDLYKGRDPRAMVVENIVKTLDLAIEYLSPLTDVFRVSRNAALLLKARVCLYEGTYRRYRGIEGDVEYLKMAYDAAGILMTMGHSLYYSTENPKSSYFDLFIQDNYENNPEVILAREYDATINLGNNISNAIPGAILGMSRDCFEEYLCANTGKPISVCGCHNPDMGFIAEMKNRDGRLLQTLCLPEEGEYARYLFREESNGTVTGGAPNIMGLLIASDGRVFNGTSSTGYALAKYYKSSEHYQGNHKGSIDAPVMRYAEALLIRAEAGAELGEDPELDKTINALRERAGFVWKLSNTPDEDEDLVSKYPNVTGPNANLIREIRRERRIELFAEGFRWDDVCRYNVGEIVYNRERRGAKLDPALYSQDEIEKIENECGVDENGFITPYAKRTSFEMNFTSKNYLYNIPINEVSLNPNLLPQNPGWE